MAGLDGWLFLDAKKKWVVSGWSGAHARRAGTRRALPTLQQSPRHYYQRPDAD